MRNNTTTSEELPGGFSIEAAEKSNNAQPLNTAKLINKFYERYPLETFSSDSVRAEALGYFMAGAELQCHGDFIHSEGCCHDE